MYCTGDPFICIKSTNCLKSGEIYYIYSYVNKSNFVVCRKVRGFMQGKLIDSYMRICSLNEETFEELFIQKAQYDIDKFKNIKFVA